jgi:hypothetical protein
LESAVGGIRKFKFIGQKKGIATGAMPFILQARIIV